MAHLVLHKALARTWARDQCACLLKPNKSQLEFQPYERNPEGSAAVFTTPYGNRWGRFLCAWPCRVLAVAVLLRGCVNVCRFALVSSQHLLFFAQNLTIRLHGCSPKVLVREVVRRQFLLNWRMRTFYIGQWMRCSQYACSRPAAAPVALAASMRPLISSMHASPNLTPISHRFPPLCSTCGPDRHHGPDHQQHVCTHPAGAHGGAQRGGHLGGW